MTALRIVATGMCCAVGYCTGAATAAMRAGMDHFRETQFVDEQGEALVGGQVHGIDIWGTKRMFWMLQHTFNECLKKMVRQSFPQTCLLLMISEPERPDSHKEWAQGILQASIKQYEFHSSSQVLAKGKTGLIAALKLAKNLLQTGSITQVLIAGVDSFFSAATITHYLDKQRLLSSANDDGFIPGEAAGAVVVTLPVEGEAALLVTGVGDGNESAHILQDELANRADGLRKAIRDAVKDSGKPLTETFFHMSAIGHESFYFREIELAILRSLEHKVADYPHLMLNSSTGEVGAASGPLMLAYLSTVMPHADGPGKKGLLHLSDDQGQRAAAIIEWRDAAVRHPQ